MKAPCFIGFDGFIDTICHVVQKRQGERYQPYSTLSSWSHQIAAASGKSGNFELELLEQRLGGNAMILASALAALGHSITWAANVADPQHPEQLHPLFEPLRHRSHRWSSLGTAGQTQALEFDDGKLLLGIQGSNSKLNLSHLTTHLGPDWVQEWLWPCQLIAMVNWTMILHMGEIWHHVAQVGLRGDPWFVVDLADPRKRLPSELHRDLTLLSPLRDQARLVLSLNRSEAEQTATALGLAQGDKLDNGDLAQAIGRKLGWFAIVIHDLRSSALASEQLLVETDHLWIDQPQITTGGGDHFNAGLCHAWLKGLELDAALRTAAHCASEFVRTGRSPTQLYLK